MIRILGTITDPSGQPVTGAMIELRALNSTAEVLAGSVLTIKCDASGNYDFQLGIGAYDVYAQNDYQGDMDYLGTGAVSAASVDGSLFSILVDGGINLTPPLLDTALDAMQRAVSSAASAAADREQTGIDAQTATDKAASAAMSESEAKSARDSIVSDAADVRQKAVAIESARQEVASNTATVSANTTATTASAADAARDAASALASKNAAKASADTTATLKSDVESMRDAVSANASTAVAAADTASQKAASAAQNEATASSAATRAEQAAQAVAAALIDAGPYDASTGVLPPPVQVSGVNKSCIWKVTGSGTAGGIELGVGDSLIYTTHGPSYYKIDNTESVTSVNGQKGIVTLTASSVGADAAGTSSDHITQHESKASAHAISGIAGLQAALNAKLDATATAAAATKLATARTIGGVSFDGSANINLPGVNAAGNQSTSGNAATATKLETARTITVGNTGKSFDGSANQSWSVSEIAGPVVSAISVGSFGAFSHRNLLINGDFRIWQRGVVGVDSNAAKYGADRFLFGCAGSAFAPYGLAYESGMPIRTGMRIGVTTGNTGVAITQRVESNNCPKVGEKLTFSWYIHGNIARAVSYSVQVGGTTDNFSSPTLITTGTVNVASGGVWQRFSVTFTTTAACLNGIEVRLDLSGSSGISTADFSTTGWQLEVGEIATPFEHRPYGYELSLCQRYYQLVHLRGSVNSPNGTWMAACYAYPVEMRATPSVTYGPVYRTIGTVIDERPLALDDISHRHINAIRHGAVLECMAYLDAEIY